jgi:hypothetical protein
MHYFNILLCGQYVIIYSCTFGKERNVIMKISHIKWKSCFPRRPRVKRIISENTLPTLINERIIHRKCKHIVVENNNIETYNHYTIISYGKTFREKNPTIQSKLNI